MALLTADRQVKIHQKLDGGGIGYILDAETIGGENTIYKGAFVGYVAGGYTRRIEAATDRVQGVALEQKTPGTNDADVTIKVVTEPIIEHAVTGSSAASVGDLVYCDVANTSGDNVLTLVATANLACGYILKHLTGTTCLVQIFEPGRQAL